MTLTAGRAADRLPRGGPAGRTSPDGRRPGPGQPELLPPRRPLPQENGEQVDKFVTDEFLVRHRLRLPGRRHQPDLLAAEARRAAADPGRRDARPQRPAHQGRAARPGAVPARRPSTTSSTSRRRQVPALPGPRRRRTTRSWPPSPAVDVQRASPSRAKVDTDVVGLRLAARHRRRGARVPRPARTCPRSTSTRSPSA